MTFLIRYEATDHHGDTVHDETVVANVVRLEALEKTVFVLGQPLTLRVSFDPPLQPSVVL